MLAPFTKAIIVGAAMVIPEKKPNEIAIMRLCPSMYIYAYRGLADNSSAIP